MFLSLCPGNTSGLSEGLMAVFCTRVLSVWLVVCEWIHVCNSSFGVFGAERHYYSLKMNVTVFCSGLSFFLFVLFSCQLSV